MIVGIDLGPTNSTIAIWRDGRAELISNALGYAEPVRGQGC
jgi:molecular chaperone HscC